MKKKTNWFLKLVFAAFIVFIGLYIASVSGYYESKVSDKVAMTDEAIKQFEQDVSEGKIVDLNTYVSKDNKDYSNNFTKAGDKAGEAVEKFITEGFGGLWDAIKVLFF